MTNDYESIRHADVILVIGSNTTENHPVIGSWIKEQKNNGRAKLIVCDPRKIELDSYADIKVRHRSGSDVALLNGMMNIIISEELYDAEFLEKNVEKFDELKALVAEYTPGKVSAIPGVPEEVLQQAARAYAKGPNSAIFYTMGITQHKYGTNNVRTVANLALLCGMLGRPGTGVNPLRGQNNVQGACDMGCLPAVLPGYLSIAKSTEQAMEKVQKLWGAKLPTSPGKTIVKIMEGAANGEIRGLFIMGENPMVSDPNTNHVRHALEHTEFLVVQDIFLTETAQMADVVLPAACWAEKDGTFTNTCRAVQRIRKAVEAPGEARSDWEIILDLARACGASWSFGSPAEIMEDISRFVPQYGGISFDRLDNGPILWPCPNKDHPGTPNLYTTGFPRGKATFVPCEWNEPHEWPDAEYPFLASTGRSLYHYHTGTMTRRTPSAEFIKSLYIEINPEDAAAMGVGEGEDLKVTSRRGSVVGEARITDRVPPKMVFVPFHFGEQPANSLTASVWDIDVETPAFKINAVKVEKA
jgi:formate dehydrogenase alpha subunit